MPCPASVAGAGLVLLLTAVLDGPGGTPVRLGKSRIEGTRIFAEPESELEAGKYPVVPSSPVAALVAEEGGVPGWLWIGVLVLGGAATFIAGRRKNGPGTP